MEERRKYDFDRVVRIVFAAVCVVAVVYLINYLSGVLLPFFVACLLAYIIHPLVKFNRRWMHCKNNVLPVVVTEPFLAELFDSIAQDPKTEVVVDLPNQTITNKATGKSEHFEINGYKKHCLMNGLDDIDYLLQNKDKIEAWEQQNN